MNEYTEIVEQAFSDYVTSTAFRIELSASQINALKAIGNDEKWQDKEGFRPFHPRNTGSVYALQRRGLLDGGRNITEAGKHTLALVKLAGL